MSLIRPVSPVRYAVRPFVNVSTYPAADPSKPVRPLSVMYCASGAVNSSLGLKRLSLWTALTMLIRTPGVPDDVVKVMLEPKPKPSVHGRASGTTISSGPAPTATPCGGHVSVRLLVRPWILWARNRAMLPLTSTADFFAAAISAAVVFAVGAVYGAGIGSHTAAGSSGFWKNLRYPM